METNRNRGVSPMNDRRNIMTRSSRATLFLVMGLVWAVTLAKGGAKPVQLACLPADTTWLLHLDVDQLKRSQVGGAFPGKPGRVDGAAQNGVFPGSPQF